MDYANFGQFCAVVDLFKSKRFRIVSDFTKDQRLQKNLNNIFYFFGQLMQTFSLLSMNVNLHRQRFTVVLS